MEWVGMNRYPISNIINALKNQKESLDDNIKLPVLKKENKFKTAILIGGGKSANNHLKAVKKLAERCVDICIIHAGARHVSNYLDINVKQYYNLVGFESDKLLKSIGDFNKLNHICVFPPYPRSMGTIVPIDLEKMSFELDAITFTDSSQDSPLALGIQTALDLGVKNIFMVGFDGYDATIDQMQFILAQENQNIIDDALKINEIDIVSITPTKYKKVKTNSIYSLI
jgi:4-hydroxy 2-oxovalerate aldolase